MKDNIVSPPSTTVAAEDDAWLNDAVPAPRETRAQNATDSAVDVPAASPTAHQENPLWPAVLSLSERIWRELRQRADLLAAPEAVQVHFVRRRVIEIMRADAALVRQVRDITQAQALLQDITREVLGYGPLERLLADESITRIVAVGPRFVYVERGETVEDVACNFADDRHMLRIVENILQRAGRRLVADRPIVDVRLPDGSLVNVVLPPSAVNGPMITILRPPREPLTAADLLAAGSMTREMADFLAACVRGRLNIVVCGAVGSGRTTLLNVLGASIAAHERIATLEAVAQLHLGQKHVMALLAQATHPDGGAGVSLRELVVNALRTGSERILVDECCGDELAELVQAINNGRGGVLMTIYAHNVRNCLLRLERMYQLAAPTLPPQLLRAQLAGALDVIVCVSRLRDGSHRILNIAEVQRVGHSAIKLQSIFHFASEGYFEASGFAPTFKARLVSEGLELSSALFRPGPLKLKQ